MWYCREPAETSSNQAHLLMGWLHSLFIQIAFIWDFSMRFITVILSPPRSFMAKGAVFILMRLWTLVCSQECFSVFYNIAEKNKKDLMMQDFQCLLQGTENPMLPLCLVGAGGKQDKDYAMKLLWHSYVPPHLTHFVSSFSPGCQSIQLFLILLSCPLKCFLTLSAGSHFHSTIAMSDNGNPQTLWEISKLCLNLSMSCRHPSLEGWIVTWKGM